MFNSRNKLKESLKSYKFDMNLVINDKEAPKPPPQSAKRVACSELCEKSILANEGESVMKVSLILFGKTMENGKSLFLQQRKDKKQLTVADTVMITLNNFEMNLVKIQKIKTMTDLNDGIKGEQIWSNDSQLEGKCE